MCEFDSSKLTVCRVGTLCLATRRPLRDLFCIVMVDGAMCLCHWYDIVAVGVGEFLGPK